MIHYTNIGNLEKFMKKDPNKCAYAESVVQCEKEIYQK